MNENNDGDIERANELHDIAQLLQIAAEALEAEAIEVKYNGEPRHPEYSDRVCTDAKEKLESLNIEGEDT